MNALVYRGINDLRIESVPVPAIQSNEILVKVAVCGVCPTDIKKIQYGTVSPPRIFGHETAGTIAKVGARVRGFRVGERVGLHHHVPCLKCHVCRHRAFAQCETYKRTGITAGFEPAGGGYAEYVRVMPFVFPGIVKIPAKNSFLEGAMLEPVNTVLKAIRRMNILRGDYVWVVGQGPIGLIFTQLLSLQGINVIASDLLESRLELARKFKARYTLNAAATNFEDEIIRITGKKGLDGAIVAVPSDEATGIAENLTRSGAQILLFAHTRRGTEFSIDPSSICVDEKDLIGSYSSDITIQKIVARLIFSRKLDVRKLITHEFSLCDSANAIQLAANPRPDSLKIVVVQK
ncbi:MAG: alcohol dehydrogenase catalytic domain-containing protein [Verrucomicrobiota bacterium]